MLLNIEKSGKQDKEPSKEWLVKLDPVTETSRHSLVRLRIVEQILTFYHVPVIFEEIYFKTFVHFQKRPMQDSPARVTQW